jgi:hypothetical protein
MCNFEGAVCASPVGSESGSSRSDMSGSSLLMLGVCLRRLARPSEDGALSARTSRGCGLGPRLT